MQDETFTINQNLINVISSNPGVPLTAGTFTAIARGTIVAHSGCIVRLLYQNDDNDLIFLRLDSGDTVSSGTATNLNDFRNRLQEAANFGHKVVYCLDTKGNKIFMLHIIPCECTCEKREGRG